LGLPAAEVDEYIAQCTQAMNPELAASAGRRAKGYSAEIRLADAFERIFGKDYPEPQIGLSGGSLIGWRIQKPDRTSSLAQAGIQSTILTSVCGVAVGEIVADTNHICRATRTSTAIAATFQQIRVRSLLA
jgi:hypothetical protein